MSAINQLARILAENTVAAYVERGPVRADDVTAETDAEGRTVISQHVSTGRPLDPARAEAVTDVLTVKFSALFERAEPGTTIADMLPEMTRLLGEALAEVG